MNRSRRNAKAALAVLVALGFPATGFGAPFVVDSPLDGVDAIPGDGVCETAANACTLRAAIQEANALAGADTIALPADVYTLTLGGAGENASATGDLDITDDLTINGAGASVSIVDGGKLDRVFHVHPGAVVTMSDIGIRNGFANIDGVGGGLANQSGIVTLNRCNVYRNTGSGFGGGIDNSSYGYSHAYSMAEMYVNQCNIYENHVLGSGGGLSTNNAILVVNDSVIRDNAGGFFPDAIQGGGIYSSSVQTIPGEKLARLEVNRSLITGHTAYSDGGGIYHLIGSMIIRNSTIVGNSAKRNGGGIYNANAAGWYLSEVVVSHSTITGNSA